MDRKNITEILANKRHVFFTVKSANDFRYAQMDSNLPAGEVKFMSEMDMDFYTGKCSQDATYAALPDDAEMMRIISAIPGFEKA